MTGFGRASHATDALAARAEISSLNRKQSEVVIQLPRPYAELESPIRKLVLSKISRGRIAISTHIETSANTPAPIQIDKAKATALAQSLKTLGEQLNQPLPLTTADLLRIPDIITFEENNTSIDQVRDALIPAIEQALEKLIQMRAREGQDLKNDTLERLSKLEAEAHQIASHAPAVIARYRENLHKRLHETGLEIDLNDERLLKEIGIFAERCDISEEITRLNSHFAKFREYLDSDKPVGRSLDFLCQELNREFNTIGSKANDATLAQHVVNAKTELEKIREQIQNAE